MERDAAAYLQLMEAKDESIVRLTNQLHEVELQAKIDQVRDESVTVLWIRIRIGSVFSSLWIRIRIQNPDPDPHM